MSNGHFGLKRVEKVHITEPKQTVEALLAGNERFKLLSEVAAQLLVTDTPQALVNTICTAVIAHLDCQAFINYIVDPSTGLLSLNACVGIPADVMQTIARCDAGAAFCGCAACDGCGIVAEDLQHSAHPRTALVKSAGLQAFACYPLRAGERLLGTLSFGIMTRTRFAPDEVAFMKTVADQIAIAIARFQAQEAHRESEDNLRAILDATQESITLYAVDGTILAANTVAADRFGRIPGTVVGQHFSKCVPAHLVESRQARLQDVIVTRHSVRFEDEQHGLIFDHTYCPIFDGRQVKRIAAFSRDITRRKQADQALSHVAEELSRSNQELEQFASVASHDLQEPLRAVSGYVSLIEERMHDRLDAKALQHIDGAIKGAERMQRLIIDLLALSRVGSQGKAFAPVDLQTVFTHAVHSLSVSLRETGAQVTHDPLPAVHADAGQLVQLFQNLLGNAIKFRGERVPEIHVGAEQQAGEWVFSVRDNGIGIEPQYFERIFLIFQRLHTRTQYPGTGIGLAICKKIIERHSGAIRVESRPGEGSTFFFTLPCKGTP